MVFFYNFIFFICKSVTKLTPFNDLRHLFLLGINYLIKTIIMKKTSLLLTLGTFLYAFSSSAQWTTIVSDASGDGAYPNLIDGTQLEYNYDDITDSLWFRITTAEINSSQALDLGVNILSFYGYGDPTFSFWSPDNYYSYNSLLTCWVTGSPPNNYTGTMGVSTANGVNTANFTEISNQLSIEVDVVNSTIVIGTKRADLIPDYVLGTSIEIVAAVGSSQSWNDDLWDPNFNSGIVLNSGSTGGGNTSATNFPNNSVWLDLLSDLTGDGSSNNLMDGTELEYFYDDVSDSLWFKVSTAGINTTQESNVGINIMANFGSSEPTFNFWGQQNNQAYNRLLTAWVTGTAPTNYSGTTGISMASGVNANNYTQIINQLALKVDPADTSIVVGFNRADLIPDNALANDVIIAAAVGSSQSWNDDIFDPNASTTINLNNSNTNAICATASIGNVTGNSIYCFNSQIGLSASSVTIPQAGTYGFVWLISTSDISNSADPINEPTVVDVEPYTTQAMDYEITNDASMLAYGSYYLTAVAFGNATDNAGVLSLESSCMAVSNSQLIELLPDYPVLSASINSVDANAGASDGQATISVSGGSSSNYSINWSNGATGLSISNLMPGNYTVTISDNSNCVADLVQNFTINQLTAIEDFDSNKNMNLNYVTNHKNKISFSYNLEAVKNLELVFLNLNGQKVYS